MSKRGKVFDATHAALEPARGGDPSSEDPMKENVKHVHNYHTLERTSTHRHPFGPAHENPAYNKNTKDVDAEEHIHLRGGAGYKGQKSVTY